MSENNKSNVGGYLLAAALGAVVGAGVALLYAPKTGKDTRKLLGRKGRELKTMAGDAYDDALDYIEDKKTRLGDALAAGKEEFLKTKKSA